MNKKTIHLKWESSSVHERNLCYMFWMHNMDSFPFILPKDAIESVTVHGDGYEFVFPESVFDKVFDDYTDEKMKELHGSWFDKLKQSSKCISIKRK